MSREETIKRYNEILDRINRNIEESEDFKKDLIDRYNKLNLIAGDIQEIVTIQSMIMKINDVISMKHQNKVEIERQLIDFENETE